MTGTKADLITTSITGEAWMGSTGWQAQPTKREIDRLAYQIYDARGRRDGHDVDDWVQAERELTHHYSYEDAGESRQVREIAALSALRNGSSLRS